MKRRVSVLLAVVLFLLCFPPAVFSAEENVDYTFTYNPGEIVGIPFDVLGEAWYVAKSAEFIVDGIGTFEGIPDFNGRAINVKMGCEPDIKKGIYNARLIIHKSGNQPDATVTGLKLAVNKDYYGSHIINSAIIYNRNSDIVLRFKNGQGDSRIVSVDAVRIMAVPKYSDDRYYSGVSYNASKLVTDLDKGEIRIPRETVNRMMDACGMNFLPNVYIGSMDFTLANGQQFKYNFIIPDKPIPSEGFKNDGSDSWYFIYEDSAYGINLPFTDSVNISEKKYLDPIKNMPSGAAVTYSSENENIVKVDANGAITGVSKGIAVVSAEVKYNGFTIANDRTIINVGGAEVLYGDANGDGSVNIKDMIHVKKYLAEMFAEVDNPLAANLDNDMDGIIAAADLVLLNKLLLNQ